MDQGDATRLTVTERREGDACRLEAEGELDLTTESLLFDPLMRAAQDPQVESVAVDLRRVIYIDTAGMAVLLVANKALGKRSRQLRVLLAPDGQVERVMRLSGILDALDVGYGPVQVAPTIIPHDQDRVH